MRHWLKRLFRRSCAPKCTAPRLRVEPLEDRTVPSQTGVALDVYLIHGTEFSSSNPLAAAFASGRGFDKNEMSPLAVRAAEALHAINPKSTVTNVVWASLGDRGTPAHALTADLKQRLAQVGGQHDVVVISFSAGNYLADQFVREASQLSATRRILSVNLDPTGNKLLGDGKFSPLENLKVHNITYHDGLNPFGSFFATIDTNPTVGENRLVKPIGNTSNGLKSHEAFPAWYAGGIVTDLLTFEQATAAEAAAARSAVARGLNPSYRVFNAPGHGENLLLPLIQRAIQAGFNEIVDDVGHIVRGVVDHPGHILVAAVSAEGKIISAIYDGAGNIVKDVTGALSHLGQNVIDVFNPTHWF